MHRKGDNLCLVTFGDDVIIVRGRGANYNNAINAVKTYAPKHAEARGIQAMISRIIPIEGARQATTLRSCVDCTGLQGAYGIINLTGEKTLLYGRPCLL